MVPYEKKYICTISYGKKLKDWDDVEFVQSSGGNIKTIPYCERWRTPEDTIKYYKGIVKILEKEFLERMRDDRA